MTYARLYARMLRYRVAVMLWMFLLLGAAFRDGLDGLSWGYAFATVALASSYVAATSLNDVADRDVDRVNHPRDSGRPLVSGDATASQLLRLHWGAVGFAFAAALPLGPAGVAVVGLSLAISLAYSAPPLRLSYRTWLAPLALAVAYVVVPYRLGLEAAGGGGFRREDAPFVAALLALFLARILLKDFRDRDGDARYGKPTLLLRSGKTVTCAASAGALLAGCTLLVVALDAPPALAATVALFGTAIALMLRLLWRTTDRRLEQVAIGIGARMGNGLLIVVLGWLLLGSRGAGEDVRALFLVTLVALFGVSFASLAARPGEVVIGYKG